MSDNETVEKLKREMEEIKRAIGIEPDFRPLTTVYNPASGIIVASVERYSSEVFERRLFFRHTSERVYRPIDTPAPDIHYDNLVTSATQPVIYYAVNRFIKREGIGGFSGDWLSIDRFDLARQVAESVITQDGLQLPEPYSRAWVSEVFGVSPDDSSIFCSCGLERRDTGKSHYGVCSIELCSQRVALLSQLEAIWF